MMTREEALAYGMSFDNVYEEKPFRDPNWQLVRIKGSKKTFLWIYEREGYINLNVKVNPEWRDFWRSTYESVTAGYHLNKEHWNTIILDGTVPEKEIKRMIRIRIRSIFRAFVWSMRKENWPGHLRLVERMCRQNFFGRMELK